MPLDVSLEPSSLDYGKIIKWGLIILGITVGLVLLIKLMSVILNTDYFKIVLTSLFGGIGSGLGLYVVGKFILRKD
jgi:hypothetical protein